MALSVLPTSVKVEILSTFCEKKDEKLQTLNSQKKLQVAHTHRLQPNNQQDMRDLSSGKIQTKVSLSPPSELLEGCWSEGEEGERREKQPLQISRVFY